MLKSPKVILQIETSRQYGRNLLRGIANYSYLHGPWTMEREIPFYIKSDRKKKSHADPNKWLADGIIMREPSNVEVILGKGIPVIFASYLKEHLPPVSRIITDDDAIGQMGADHFLERGFRHFAYLGYDEMYWSRNRCFYFQEHVSKAGYQIHTYSQAKQKTERSWTNEQFLVADWLKSLPKPVALLACNDDRGQQAISACRTGKLQVPYEVAILGVDNDEFVCTLSNPPISSINLSTEKAGYLAAELLDNLMKGKKIPPQNIMVNPTYVSTRQSSDVLAIEDHEVSQAIIFIREHSREPIQVEEVASAVGTSRRNLSDKIKNVIGLTLHEEITRTRIEQISKLLVNSKLSILQIAQALGYFSDKHLARYFRRQKGISPLEYRKKHGLYL